MSEDSGAAKLSAVQFYRACETLKKHKQVFFDERPIIPRAAEMLTKLCEFHVPKGSVVKIKEATGVEWESRHSPRNGGTGKPTNYANRTLAIALVRLYRKLGEEIPGSLFALHEYLHGRSFEEESATSESE